MRIGALLVVFGAAPAFAQLVPPPAQPETDAPQRELKVDESKWHDPDVKFEQIEPRRDLARPRFGVGYWAAYVSVPSSQTQRSDRFGAFGVSLQAGLQVSDAFAVFVQGQVSTIVLTSVAGAAAFAEVTLGLISVGAGFGASFAHTLFSGPRVDAALGAPLRIAVSLGRDPGPELTRHRFYVCVEGFGGVSITDPSAGLQAHVGAGFGYQMM